MIFCQFSRDNPEVDIVGANIYNALLQKNQTQRRGSLTGCGLLAHPRLLSAKSCESILVCTGVYNPSIHKINTKQNWGQPTTIQLDALDAVTYCLQKENLIWNSFLIFSFFNNFKKFYVIRLLNSMFINKNSTDCFIGRTDQFEKRLTWTSNENVTF